MLEMMMVGSNNNIKEPLLAGTYTKGWYGEVAAVDFITGDALASAIGLSAGTAINSTAGWLKFSLDSKTLYVAKRPFRYNLNWNAINLAGAVLGTKTIIINGKTYKVRLLNGRGDGVNTVINGSYDTSPTWNSEWNRLMYHVSGTPFANSSNTLASEGISVGDWAQYSEADLLMYTGNGVGNQSWCQAPAGAGVAVTRGKNGVSYILSVSTTSVGTNLSWRPCLELVD